MASRTLGDKELSEIYQQFDSLGNWVNEEGIGDYPVLGGSTVSAKYMFQQMTERLLRYGRHELPHKFVQVCK